MEKFRQWDDESNGLNPFTPLETKSQYTGAIKIFLRGFLSVFLITLRFPCILLVLWVQFFLHALKYLLIFPVLIRFVER